MTRASREEQTRAKVWTPPSALDAPAPRDGMVQRWVATSIQGKDDPAHVSKRMREGWQPRKPETVPENFHAPTIEHGRWEGCIGVEGMVLMEMPKDLADQRNAYYRQKAADLTAFVDRDLDAAERGSKVKIRREHDLEATAGGRKVHLQDD